MITFDYKCPACGRKQEMRVKDVDATVYCHNCDTIMERLLAAPYGKVIGYNYKNGYSKEKGTNDQSP